MGDAAEKDALVDRIKAVIDREVYCTVIIRSEHNFNCNGDCEHHGCPIQVQDYGDTADLARAIAEELARITQPDSTAGGDA